MKPFQRILVPTDFSAHATEAMHVAIDLAKRYGASIHLVHVFQSVAYVMPDGYVSYSAPQLRDIMGELDKLLESAKQQVIASGITLVETDLLEGAPATEVARFAATRHSDLIVMGTHGRTGLKHALIGSIAEKVVRSAPCPVLTVKAAKEDRPTA